VPAALLIDLDGVLVDSTESVEGAWRRWAGEHGVDYAAIALRMHGIPSRQTIAAVAPHLDVAAEARRVDAIQAEDTAGVHALPGARELMADGHGDALAIVTSCSRRLADARLAAAGISPPPVIVTSDQVERGKPDPEAYVLAAHRLGREPADCIVIEDAPAGVAAGKAAGMRVVAVLTTHDAARLADADELIADLRSLRGALAV
jgi:mannitol-1-/sugar-/sorbitol-6-phosphatase